MKIDNVGFRFEGDADCSAVVKADLNMTLFKEEGDPIFDVTGEYYLTDNKGNFFVIPGVSNAAYGIFHGTITDIDMVNDDVIFTIYANEIIKITTKKEWYAHKSIFELLRYFKIKSGRRFRHFFVQKKFNLIYWFRLFFIQKFPFFRSSSK